MSLSVNRTLQAQFAINKALDAEKIAKDQKTALEIDRELKLFQSLFVNNKDSVAGLIKLLSQAKVIKKLTQERITINSNKVFKVINTSDLSIDSNSTELLKKLNRIFETFSDQVRVLSVLNEVSNLNKESADLPFRLTVQVQLSDELISIIEKRLHLFRGLQIPSSASLMDFEKLKNPSSITEDITQLTSKKRKHSLEVTAESSSTQELRTHKAIYENTSTLIHSSTQVSWYRESVYGSTSTDIVSLSSQATVRESVYGYTSTEIHSSTPVSSSRGAVYESASAGITSLTPQSMTSGRVYASTPTGITSTIPLSRTSASARITSLTPQSRASGTVYASTSAGITSAIPQARNSGTVYTSTPTGITSVTPRSRVPQFIYGTAPAGITWSPPEVRNHEAIYESTSPETPSSTPETNDDIFEIEWDLTSLPTDEPFDFFKDDDLISNVNSPSAE